MLLFVCVGGVGRGYLPHYNIPAPLPYIYTCKCGDSKGGCCQPSIFAPSPWEFWGLSIVLIAYHPRGPRCYCVLGVYMCIHVCVKHGPFVFVADVYYTDC